MARRSRIVKMGTRGGKPHYGVGCMVCPPTPGGPERILAVAHVQPREAAVALFEAHWRDVHEGR